MYTHRDRQRDRWIDRWMDGWMDGWREGWMDTDRWTESSSVPPNSICNYLCLYIRRSFSRKTA